MFAGGADAQNTFVVDMNISTTKAKPIVDGVQHVIEGADFEYKIIPNSAEEIVKITKFEYSVTLGDSTVSEGIIENGFSDGLETIPLGILEVGEYEYKLQGKIEYLVEGNEQPQTQEISATHKIKVWNDVAFPKSHEGIHCALPGETVSLGITDYSGGNDNGWIFEWSGCNSTTDKYSFTAPNVEEEESKKYELNVKNLAPDNTSIWGEAVYEFTVTVYPSISVTEKTYDKNVYYGDNVTLGVDYSGGKSDGWSFEWKNLPNENNPSFSYNVKENDKANNVATYKLVVTNTYKQKGDWYYKEFTFKVNEWSKGNAQWTGITDVLSDSVNQFLSYEGGYTDGWEIKWHIDNKEQTGFDKKETRCIFENHSSVCEEKFIKIDIKNSINAEKTGYTNTFTNKVNVWPRVILPSAIENAEKFIREGEEGELSATAASGGYYSNDKKTWIYTWYRNGQEITGNDNKCTVEASTDNVGHKKHIEKVTYQLNVSNLSPQGQVWVSKDISQEVFVYRRPKTPLKLQRKGNGSSCMFILGSEYNDEELAEYEYEFIYGYTDAYGVEHMSESTANRYVKFDEITYNDPSNTFWVFAQWKYDNALVTSGKLFANGEIDETYNASVFGTTTRGGQTSINKFACKKFDITGNRLKADFAGNVTLRINVYNLTGALVKVIHYPSSSSFNEIIDLDELARGIYVIEACAGDMHIVNKVVVD